MELTLREIPRFVPPWCFAAASLNVEAPTRRQTRQAYIQLKLKLMRAASDIAGESGSQLRFSIHEACEPIELWLLEQKLVLALPNDCPRRDQHQLGIQWAMQELFEQTSKLLPACSAGLRQGDRHPSRLNAEKAFGHRRRDD